MIKLRYLIESLVLEKLKDEVEIVSSTPQEVAQFVQKHYLHQFPKGTRKVFAVNKKNTDGTKNMVGTIIYGVPFHTAGKFLQQHGIQSREVLELKRLFIDDIGLRNIESFVIGQSIKKLKQEMPEIKAVITFADSKAGHVGSIYQATNAIYVGTTNDGKHKYLYDLQGDLPIQSQPYPKKEITEIEKYQAKWDLLNQIKGEIENEREKTRKSHSSPPHPPSPDDFYQSPDYRKHTLMQPLKTPNLTQPDNPPEEEDEDEKYRQSMINFLQDPPI